MKIIIATKDGTVVESINLAGYNLRKALARAEVLSQIEEAIERGRAVEESETRAVADCHRCSGTGIDGIDERGRRIRCPVCFPREEAAHG